MKTSLFLIAVLSILGRPLSFGQTEAEKSSVPVNPPARENSHLHPLMGQSNMAGRDTRQLAAQVENPRGLALNAEGKWVIDVWPEGKMPGKGARDPEADKSPEKTDATRITNVSRPTLSVFPAPEKNAPAVIICPGGGYGYVVVDKEGSEIAVWLNSIGITGVVLKYRNPNNRAGALQDVQRSMRLVRSHAKDWNVDAGKIGVMGFSAGGHLCARASTDFETAAYPEVDEIDKFPCRPDFAVLVYPAYLGNDGHVAPELPVSNKVPPTLIVHSEDDAKFVSGSKLYDAALTKSGAPHEYALYQTGGHGYGLHCEREAKVWPERCRDWLRGMHILTNEAPGAGRIILVGDSTVASKSGWGDALAMLCKPGVECLNMGRGGRSSKSYRDEGHWKKVLAAKPDWVLIQFGHNDQPGKGPERETDAKTTFRENLTRYIAETRAAGAKPVLVTSLTRRNFNARGKIEPAHLASGNDAQAGEMRPDFLNDYVVAARAVAAEQKVPLIDLNARSIEQMNQLGPEAAAEFDAKSKDPAKPDKTHLSAKGAQETAKLVADEIRKNSPELAGLLLPAP